MTSASSSDDQPPLNEPPSRFSAAGIDHFSPSWKRLLFVALLAFGAFFIPQKIALDWYPLNEPGNDIHYLEATLRTNTTGTIRILYDCGFGFIEPYSITIPVASSDMAFTYIFPLPDAPIRKLFIDPPDAPGELEFTRFRIINRREEEVRNFSPDEFKISPGLQLQPTPHGWKLVANTSTSSDAGADIDFKPIRPIGMNARNFKRCLLSWSYLSFMLWLIVLAIYLIFLNHLRGKDILRSTAFLLLVCALMSVVGNRGLIKNSNRISSFKPVKVPPGHTLELVMASAQLGEVQLTTKISSVSSTPQVFSTPLAPHPNLQTVRFTLPEGTMLYEVSLEIPAGCVKIMSLRLIDGGKYTAVEIPVAQLSSPETSLAATTAGVPFIQLTGENTRRSLTLSTDALHSISERLTSPPRITP